MHTSSRFQTPAAHPHTPPPHAPRPRWPYPHRFHEGDPEDYPSAPVTPSPTTDPADMPEHSPILEHPEHTASPSPIVEPTPQASPARERNSSLPPLPAEAEGSAVPAAVRLPDPAAATPRHTRVPPPIIAPTPSLARSPMSTEAPSLTLRAPATPLAGTSHQHQGGSSSDESPVSDHVLLHRPGTGQARPKSSHRVSGSVNHAPQASEGITHPVRTLSYNSAAGRSRRNDRPERPRSAGLTGVGPDPYGQALNYVIPTGPLDNGGEKRDSKMGLSMVSARENTVKERLQPTIDHAIEARIVARRKARISGYALNICIGIQVVLGAITTGVAAASTTSRTSTSVGIPILGGLSTLAASYLARSRGSGEPERSIVLAHDLDHFIRDAEAFMLDHGHLVGPEYNKEVQGYRARFEEIMGHNPGKNSVQPKDLEAGYAAGPRSLSSDGYAQMPNVQSMYAVSGHQVLPVQMPVSPMAQALQTPGSYFVPAVSPPAVSTLAQTGYANGGATAGAALQMPQMAHVPPTATTGYPVSQPVPVSAPLPVSTPTR